MMGQGITRGCSGGGRMILIAILFVAMLLNWCYCVSLPTVEISLVMGMIYVIANIEILWQISVALRIVAMLIAIIVIAILCVAVNSYTNNNYTNNSYVDSNNSYSNRMQNEVKHMKIFGVNKNSIEEDKEVHFTRERGVSRSGNNGDLIDVMEVTE